MALEIVAAIGALWCQRPSSTKRALGVAVLQHVSLSWTVCGDVVSVWFVLESVIFAVTSRVLPIFESIHLILNGTEEKNKGKDTKASVYPEANPNRKRDIL